MKRKEKVTKIINGDTFMTDRRKNPVRLLDVDVPGRGRRGCRDAKEELKNLIADKDVIIETESRDPDGTSVANVLLGKRSINRAMRGFEKLRTWKFE